MNIGGKLLILSVLLDTFGLHRNADIVVERMTRVATNLNTYSEADLNDFISQQTSEFDDYLDVPFKAKKYPHTLHSLEPKEADIMDKLEIYNPLDEESFLKPIGNIEWSEYDKNVPFVEWTELNKRYHGKGIGSAMYDRLIKTLSRSGFNEFMSGDDVSQLARKVYQHLRNQGHEVKPITQTKYWDKQVQNPMLDEDIAQAKGGPDDFSVFNVKINPHVSS